MDESSPKRFRPPTEEGVPTVPAPVMPGPRPMKAPPRPGGAPSAAAAARVKGRGGRYPFTPQNSFADARRYLASLPGAGGAGAGTGATGADQQLVQQQPQPATPRQPLSLPSAVVAPVAMEEAPASSLPFNSQDITHMVAMKRMQLEDKFTSGELSAEQSATSQEASDYDSDMELSDIDGAQKRLLLRQQHPQAVTSSSGSSPLVMRVGQPAQRPSPRPADSVSPLLQQETITATATLVEAAGVKPEQLSPAPSDTLALVAPAPEAIEGTAASVIATKCSISPSPATHRKSLADVGEIEGGNLLSCQTETRRHTISVVSGRLVADNQLLSLGHDTSGDDETS